MKAKRSRGKWQAVLQGNGWCQGVHTQGRKAVAPKMAQPRGVWVGEFAPENS